MKILPFLLFTLLLNCGTQTRPDVTIREQAKVEDGLETGRSDEASERGEIDLLPSPRAYETTPTPLSLSKKTPASTSLRAPNAVIQAHRHEDRSEGSHPGKVPAQGAVKRRGSRTNHSGPSLQRVFYLDVQIWGAEIGSCCLGKGGKRERCRRSPKYKKMVQSDWPDWRAYNLYVRFPRLQKGWHKFEIRHKRNDNAVSGWTTWLEELELPGAASGETYYLGLWPYATNVGNLEDGPGPPRLFFTFYRQGDAPATEVEQLHWRDELLTHIDVILENPDTGKIVYQTRSVAGKKKKKNKEIQIEESVESPSSERSGLVHKKIVRMKKRDGRGQVRRISLFGLFYRSRGRCK